MLTLTETDTRLEIDDPMPAGTRVFFGLIALIPLLAPYELLVKIRWENIWNFFFVFSLLICLGALAVSAAVLMAALAGVSTRMVFDRPTRTLTITRSAPVYRPGPVVYPLTDILSIQIDKHDWSDSAPDYSLAVLLSGERRFTAGRSSSRAEMEQLRRRLLTFLGWPQPPA